MEVSALKGVRAAALCPPRTARDFVPYEAASRILYLGNCTAHAEGGFTCSVLLGNFIQTTLRGRAC